MGIERLTVRTERLGAETDNFEGELPILDNFQAPELKKLNGGVYCKVNRATVRTHCRLRGREEKKEARSIGTTGEEDQPQPDVGYAWPPGSDDLS